MPRNEAEWNERAERHPVALDAYARRGGEDVIRVRVSEISFGGCQLVSAKDFEVGDDLILTLPRMGEVTGQVRWIAGDKVGVAFVYIERTAAPRRSGGVRLKLR